MNIPQESLDKFARVGITTDNIKAFIDEGRQKGLNEVAIKNALQNNYSKLYQKSGLNRGQNLGGGIRKVLTEIPLIGTYEDEAEAFLRSKGKTSGEEYDKYLKNARESVAGANRKLAKGNWLDRNAGTALNVTSNALGAALTGGATLMPGVSAAQGAIEGFGAGEGAEQRAILGGAGGAIGYIVPKIMNKIIPTETVQKAAIQKYTTPTKDALTPLNTKGENVLTSLATKAMTEGKLPEEVLSENMTRATKDSIKEGLKSGAYANKYVARPVFESAAKNLNTPYIDYMTDAVKAASPKYANKLGSELAKIGLESGDDVLMYGDVRPQVVEAINSAMRGADKAAKQEVSKAAEKAISDRASAKILTKVLSPKSYEAPEFRWNIQSLLSRYLAHPIKELGNKGTVNTLTGKVLMDDASRGATDAILEQVLGPRRY